MPGFEVVSPVGEVAKGSVGETSTWSRPVSSLERLEISNPHDAEDGGVKTPGILQKDGVIAGKAEQHGYLRDAEDGGIKTPGVLHKDDVIVGKAEQPGYPRDAEDGGVKSPSVLHKDGTVTSEAGKLVSSRDAEDGGTEGPCVQSTVTTTQVERHVDLRNAEDNEAKYSHVHDEDQLKQPMPTVGITESHSVWHQEDIKLSIRSWYKEVLKRNAMMNPRKHGRRVLAKAIRM